MTETASGLNGNGLDVRNISVGSSMGSHACGAPSGSGTASVWLPMNGSLKHECDASDAAQRYGRRSLDRGARLRRWIALDEEQRAMLSRSAALVTNAAVQDAWRAVIWRAPPLTVRVSQTNPIPAVA